MKLKLVLFVTCMWHTTLTHRFRDHDKDLIKEVYLINQPKIGTKVHDNGLVWKVKKTERTCTTPPQEKK